MSCLTESNKGHGRLETRTCEALQVGGSWLDWPGAQQIVQLTRTRRTGKETTTEKAWYVTSLPRTQADTRRLLALTRNHWAIENQLHYVRDVTFGEDACRARTGGGPQILAAARNAAIHLLKRARRTKRDSIAAAVRYFAAFPQALLALAKGEPTKIDF